MVNAELDTLDRLCRTCEMSMGIREDASDVDYRLEVRENEPGTPWSARELVASAPFGAPGEPTLRNAAIWVVRMIYENELNL